jgi:hypothetical protein
VRQVAGPASHAQDADAPGGFAGSQVFGGEQPFDPCAQGRELFVQQSGLKAFQQLVDGDEREQFLGIEPQAGQLEHLAGLAVVHIALAGHGEDGRVEALAQLAHQALERGPQDLEFSQQLGARDRHTPPVQDVVQPVELVELVHLPPRCPSISARFRPAPQPHRGRQPQDILGVPLPRFPCWRANAGRRLRCIMTPACANGATAAAGTFPGAWPFRRESRPAEAEFGDDADSAAIVCRPGFLQLQIQFAAPGTAASSTRSQCGQPLLPECLSAARRAATSIWPCHSP